MEQADHQRSDSAKCVDRRRSASIVERWALVRSVPDESARSAVGDQEMGIVVGLADTPEKFGCFLLVD
jgi:hypothetical protein